MPAQVPTINVPQVEVAPTAGDNYAQVNATPAQFGGYIGQAMSGLGNSLDTQSKQLEGAAQFGDQIANETWGTQALTEAAGQMADASAKFYSLHGQAAVEQYPNYIKQIQGIHDTILGQMPSPAAKAMAGQSMGYRMSMAFMGAGRFVAEQRLNWNLQATGAAADQNALDAVNHRADPTASAAFIASGAANTAHMWALKGADPQTQQIMSEQYVGKATGQMVAALVQDGDVAEAQARFDAVRASMDPQSQLRIEAYLKPHVDNARAQQIVNGAAFNGPARVPTTTAFPVLTNAVMGAESGGRQYAPDGTVLTSPKGAIGSMQITPAALADVNKVNGTNYTMADLAANPTLNKQVGATYLQMQVQHFQDPTLGVAAYNAGPGAVDSAIGQYGDPRTGATTYRQLLSHLPAETQAYVAKIAAHLNLGAGIGTTDTPPSTPFDAQAFMARVAAQTVHETPDVARRAMSLAALYARQQIALGGQARAAVRVQVGQASDALWNGQNAPIPTAAIQSAYPAPQAAQIIQGLHVAQVGGQVLAPMQFASQQEIAAFRADLANGTGDASAALRHAAGIAMGPDGKPLPEGVAADFATRQHVLQLFDQRMKLRDQALKTDPAGFVLGDPAVAADYQKAVASNNPADFGAYAVAATAELARLGVPAARQFVLPAQDAQKIAGSVTTADPMTAAATLTSLAQHFGSAWPQVFGQLVAQQHLPGDLRVIPTMTAPGQAVARTDLIVANQVMQAKGGQAAWTASVLGPGIAGQVQKALAQNNTLRAFGATVMPRGAIGAPRTLEAVQSAVSRLALYYAGQSGMTPDQAVHHAVDGVVGLRYDMDGALRVPKGTLPQVQSQITQIEAGVTDATLAPSYTDVAKGLIVNAPKLWVTNRTDNGVEMRVRGNDGILYPVLGVNGKPIGFKFADMAHNAPAPAGSALPDMSALQ